MLRQTIFTASLLSIVSISHAANNVSQCNTSVTSLIVDGNTKENEIFFYQTDFNTDGWSGDLLKEKVIVATDGSQIREIIWRASQELPSKGSRNIMFAPPSGNGDLINFNWSNLQGRAFAGTNFQDALNKDSNGTVDNKGKDRVKFIRDDSCGTDCSSFRERTGRIGDIINSAPVLVKEALYVPYRADTLDGSSGDYRSFQTNIASRDGMIYVGSNDGMLHAFESETGIEKFTFIPSAVINNLNVLTDPEYGINSAEEDGTLHRYFVDGSPVVADVYFDGQWRTVLLGSLGAGGRSVFALDITSPAAPKLLWEFSNTDNPAMGVSIPQPTIARLHSGQWAALIPNGYNSSGSPTLFVRDIKTGEEIATLSTSAQAANNGLSNIRTVDVNGDGIVDYVYGGDQLGNVWRFDLIKTSHQGFGKCSSNCSVISDDYRVAFGNNPLFTAKDTDGEPRPITAAPTLLQHPTSLGHLVIVGTGRYLGFEDKNTPFSQETLYGIWDRQTDGATASTTKALTRGDLQGQTMSGSTMLIAGETRSVRLVSENKVQWYKANAQNTSDSSVDRWGWMLDFKTGSSSNGERIINSMRIYGQGLIFSTITPNSDPCSAGLDGFTYAINPATGGRTAFNVFDFSDDGLINFLDSLNGDVVSGFENPAGGFTIHDGFLYAPDGSSIGISPGPGVERQSWHLIPSEE